jgi:hypothetical protein
MQNTAHELQQGQLSSAGQPQHSHILPQCVPLSGNRQVSTFSVWEQERNKCPAPAGLAVTFPLRENGINTEEI